MAHRCRVTGCCTTTAGRRLPRAVESAGRQPADRGLLGLLPPRPERSAAVPRTRPGPPPWSCPGVTSSAGGVVTGVAGAPYVPGLLALRIGPLMERAVHGLATRPDVVLLDATGRDHPRGAGLALQLGAVLGLPTVGITHRPLLARGRVARRPPRGDKSAAARRQGRRMLDAHAAGGPPAGRAPRLAGRPGHGGRAGGEHLGAMADTRTAAPCAPRARRARNTAGDHGGRPPPRWATC